MYHQLFSYSLFLNFLEFLKNEMHSNGIKIRDYRRPEIGPSSAYLFFLNRPGIESTAQLVK